MKKPDYAAAKAQVSMRDLLEHYLDADAIAAFTQKVDQLRGSCILCGTQKRSTLSINTEKNCYQSFCCKSKGNILDFVAEKEEITIDDAVHLLFDWFDIEMEAPGASDEENDQAFPIQDNSSNEPLSFELKNIDPGHEKVKALNISEATASHFGAGYYQGRGMFKDHVVFPIHNVAGELVGYAGTDGEELEFRYPENFRRDIVLFNAHRVSESLASNSDPIFIAHSPLDVARLYEVGVRHSVGTMNGILGPDQLNIMAYIANVSSDNLQPSAVHDSHSSYSMSDDEVLSRGADILAARMKSCDLFTKPGDAKEFLKLKLSHLEREVFMCLYLDSKNQLIAFEDLFAGTIDQVSVYPREIVKQSLKHNANAVIVGHNHPSMNIEPSPADKNITKKIKKALSTLDIRLLDHIIVGGDETCSLAERGYM